MLIPLIEALGFMLIAGKLGGMLFQRLRQPAVLGELIAGVVIGNLVLFQPSWILFEPLRTGNPSSGWPQIIASLSRLGVILLLFDAGLQSTVGEMRRVAKSSALVALAGVALTLVLGYCASAFLIKNVPEKIAATVPGFNLSYVHLFVGTMLCSTSAGIAVRVFRDLRKIDSHEAKIVLGAAVFDDIFGLLLLSIVSRIIASAETGAGINVMEIVRVAIVATAFLVGAVTLGSLVIPHYMRAFASVKMCGAMLTAALLICLLLSWLATVAGLDPIIGAFAAGLVLEPVHFESFSERDEIEKWLRPLMALFVPLFFVLTGMQMHLETLLRPDVLAVSLCLIVTAVLGKSCCAIAAPKSISRLVVWAGMIPRGEVTLIFAGIGRQLGVVSETLFSAVLIVVLATTILAPPALKLLLEKKP